MAVGVWNDLPLVKNIKGEEASVCSESASVSLLEMAVAALFQSMSSFQALGSIGMPVTSANS